MRRSLFASAMLTIASPAVAGVWLEGGDRQTRADVETLAAAGLIRGPVNAWPLPWAQIVPALSSIGTQSPEVASAARRLRALADRAGRPTRLEVRAAATNESALIRDFGDTAREDAEISARVEQEFGALTLSLGAGYRSSQQGRDWHFEPSSATLKLGNWALYGGYVDVWHGPGNNGALLFSNAARPFPKIGIKRLSPDAFDLPVLKWLGPWRFDAFAGVLTGHRRDFDNPAVIGFRFGFAPAAGLEIGLNRALQLCGQQRPCSAKVIGNALVGFGNADNSGTANEPGNQIAGWDISYTSRIGAVAAKVYLEGEAEDEDNVIVDKYSYLGGVTLSGALGSAGNSWRAGFEWTDTLARKFPFGSTRYPGVTYTHFIYTDGYTYRGRPIGFGVGGDARQLSLGLALTDPRDRRIYGALRRADLNRSGINISAISANPERINIAVGGIELPTAVGDFRLEGRVQDDSPNTPGYTQRKGQVEVAWRARF